MEQGKMKEIRLSGMYSDHVMLVSEDIYERMNRLCPWYGLVYKNLLFYVRKTIWSGKKNITLRAHRQAGVFYGILESLDDPREIDHINHNGLDNRRTNLRAVTRGENHQNRNKLNGCTSHFKGVHWDKKSNIWIATIKSNYKTYHLGSFRNEIEAAQNYDMAARNMGYIESSLNFPQMRSTND
jgi:hypothetical protein